MNPGEAPPVELLTASELAARWRVHRSTVYRWQHTRKIVSERIGGTIRFPSTVTDPRLNNTAAEGGT
jgi:excisionase family DNA binding protein